MSYKGWLVAVLRWGTGNRRHDVSVASSSLGKEGNARMDATSATPDSETSKKLT